MPARLGEVAHEAQLVRTAFAGLRVRFATVRRRSSRSLGTRRGPTGGSRPSAEASGARSCISIIIITPDAPSIVAWWYFVSSAHRPLSKPSMTYTSHSGRLRSIGRPTMRETCSAELIDTSRRGDAQVADVEVEIEVRIVDPVRVVEAERHLDHAPAHRLERPTKRVPVVDGLVRVEVGTRPGVDAEPVDVSERRRRLHVQEAAVESCQLLHVLHPRPTVADVEDPHQRVAGARGGVPHSLAVSERVFERATISTSAIASALRADE